MNLDNLIIDGSFITILFWFEIYGVLGWIWESAYRTVMEKKLINSGFLTGPLIPIYGFGALLYIALMHWTTNPILLFFSGGIIACALEYITSVVLERIFHARWWDYSKNFLNVNGRICLLGFVGFGGFAIILPYIQLGIGQFVAAIPDPWHWILPILTLVIILFDTAATVYGLLKFNDTLMRIQKEISRQAAPLTKLINRGKNNFEIRIEQDKRRFKEVFSAQQSRIFRMFPMFKSLQYPEALIRIQKLYDDSVKQIEKDKSKSKKTKQ